MPVMAGRVNEYQGTITCFILQSKKKLMCQDFSEHLFKQLFAAFHNLRVTNSHSQSEVFLDYKTPQYIQPKKIS